MLEPGAEWLVEEGIAEHRAVRLEGDRVVEARIAWPGKVAAGSVIEAVLIARAAGSTRGTARAQSGEDVLVDRLPREASEGAALRLLITRAALDGPGRLKRAQARPSSEPPRATSLAKTLGGATVRRFPACDWDELVAEALQGQTAFPGGALIFTPTPAMTTVDIDGELAPRALALAAVAPLAMALRRFDIGGSVAVDFPTLSDKADRRAVDQALGEALSEWPHERTAMNGFGLVQIVSRLERPSLLQLAAWRRSAFVWRALLRRAERLEGPGWIELALHPALERVADLRHVAELERRSGKRVKIRTDDALAIETPHAQLITDD